jgi:hypothetical protein
MQYSGGRLSRGWKRIHVLLWLSQMCVGGMLWVLWRMAWLLILVRRTEQPGLSLTEEIEAFEAVVQYDSGQAVHGAHNNLRNLYLLRAREWIADGRNEEARYEIDRAISVGVTVPDVYFASAELLLLLDDHEAATEAVRRGEAWQRKRQSQ